MTNLTGIAARTVTVATSGTPVQGPDVKVPDGVTLLVVAHRGNAGVVTVADSSANALNSGTNNKELGVLEALELQVNNMNQLWFDSTSNGDLVELLAEQG